MDGWLGYDFILHLFDKTPIKVEVKGEFNSFNIFVTSSSPPEECVNNTNDPLMRKVNIEIENNHEIAIHKREKEEFQVFSLTCIN